MKWIEFMIAQKRISRGGEAREAHYIEGHHELFVPAALILGVQKAGEVEIIRMREGEDREDFKTWKGHLSILWVGTVPNGKAKAFVVVGEASEITERISKESA
jgi:hypothetical protein